MESEPGFIENHMVDNGDGTVTVLFYEEPAEKREDAVKRYVTIQKTVAVNRKNENIGANGALWVQLYEKAFLASGLKESHLFGRYQYSDIGGGSERYAMGWITGKSVVALNNLGETEFTTPDFMYERDEHRRLRYSERFRHVAKEVKSRITEALKDKKTLTASTWARFTETTGPGLNGEGTRRGIASRHVYTVIGLERIDGVDYIRLRNPGGAGVIETVKNEYSGRTATRMSNDKSRYGSFLLDFDTFTEHFGSVYAA